MENVFNYYSFSACTIEFDDYTVGELCDITRLIVSQNHMAITDVILEKLRKIFDRKY